MARIVIADAGPLIALARVEQLSLLRSLFAEVFLSETIRAECLAKQGVDSARIMAALSAGWLHCQDGPNDYTPRIRGLGPGERSALHMALQDSASSLLIVDDRLARREAAHHGLFFIGTAMVLYLAEQQGLIKRAETVVEEMAATGYRINVSILHSIRNS